MGIFSNLDLLSVGITAAGTGILGFAIFFSDRQSITNRVFLYFSLVTMCWGIVSYLNYNIANDSIVLWVIRSVLFFAVFQAYFFFTLMFVFPQRESKFPYWFKIFLLPIVLITAALTLSPFVFSSIERIPSEIVAQPIPSAGIGLFAIVGISLVIAGIIIMLRKMIKATGTEKIQYKYLLTGMGVTFILIIFFDLIAFIVFNTTKYIPLSSVFIFPFILSTSYTMYKHKSFNIKAVTVVIAAFILAVFSFLNIVYAQSESQIAINITLLAAVIVGSILLIQTSTNLEVRNEQLSESMSFATHEIRTPATAIKGISKNALEGDLGALDPAMKNTFQSIYITGSTLIDLVGQYLDKSKLELNQMSYNFVTFDMGSLLKEIEQEFQPNAEFHKITLKNITNAGETYNVNADQGKIKEVLRNLIDNAIKYNNSGGSVTYFSMQYY